MNKLFAYCLVALFYIIYFVLKYATIRDENICIKTMVEIYYFVATLFLGMTIVI